jgi:hypothetical protein
MLLTYYDNRVPIFFLITFKIVGDLGGGGGGGSTENMKIMLNNVKYTFLDMEALRKCIEILSV